MNDNASSARLGPPPFPFTPRKIPMQSRAFSRPFQALACVIVAGCAYWLFSLWSSGQLSTGQGSAAGQGLYWYLAALALLVYTLFCILTSVTTLSTSSLDQSFVWSKHVELNELAYVKLIRVPGLDWLIAPRLYCRTLLGKFSVFYACDPQMIAEFERLRDELKAFRQIR
ncbi:hypothetical protein [Variovorax sp. PCZ-1]|uniref:hypothetical protein n=1 Tax=Variovorax sp. PCZ-1 TaxID=2835533 RepID=UPI001BCDBABC|nr:hypothetical protein [Variovorax sp. PCZ-1]MBS7807274.1 hypothetical protein [Variovorax sp. PCZ-1]